MRSYHQSSLPRRSAFTTVSEIIEVRCAFALASFISDFFWSSLFELVRVNTGVIYLLSKASHLPREVSDMN